MKNQAVIVAKRIYHEWDAALSSKNTTALLTLYDEDAILESPLVAHLLGTEIGICHGKQEIQKVLEILFTCQPAVRQFYRTDYFTDGKTLVWEYPRKTPTGEQMDFMEVMDLQDVLIIYHRVYWGWYGVKVIKEDLHHQQIEIL